MDLLSPTAVNRVLVGCTFIVHSDGYAVCDQVKSFHSADDDDWRRGWSDSVGKNVTTCPACGGALKAIGLTPEERARIRDTLFRLAGLQVKKHARSRQVIASNILLFAVYC